MIPRLTSIGAVDVKSDPHLLALVYYGQLVGNYYWNLWTTMVQNKTRPNLGHK